MVILRTLDLLSGRANFKSRPWGAVGTFSFSAGVDVAALTNWA
jgi:hypothetical protein